MFKSKKRLKQLKEAKQQLELEKQELLFIKSQLEDTTPKVDISNIYVWKDNDLWSIVKLNVRKIRGKNWVGIGREVNGYHSTLIDIFSGNIVYEKKSTNKIEGRQYIPGNHIEYGYYAFLLPLHDIDKDLLAYANKKVPLYVLQQLYYKLNNIDVNAYMLEKEK